MITIRVNQDSSGVIAGTVVDGAGAAVAGSRLTSVLFTLFDVETHNPDTSPVEGIINHHVGEEVLGASPSVVDEAGAYTIPLEPEDNPVLTPRRAIERHRAVLLFIWPQGQYQEDVEIEVRRVTR